MSLGKKRFPPRFAAEDATLGRFCCHTALAMARDGAERTTLEQMSKILHLTGNTSETDAAFAGVIDALNHGGMAGEDRELYKLVVANALWLQSGYPIHPEYAQRVRSS